MSLHEYDKEAVYRLRARRLLMGRAAPPPVIDPERTRPGNDLQYEAHHTSFDSKIVLITAAFLAVLLALLALHCVVRCLLRRLHHHSLNAVPDGGQLHPHPMKKRHIRSLPSATFHPLLGPQVQVPAPHCPICLADFADGELIRLLPPCRHGFHASCLDLWLLRQATCPTCRADLQNVHERPSTSVKVVHMLVTPTHIEELCPSLTVSGGATTDSIKDHLNPLP